MRAVIIQKTALQPLIITNWKTTRPLGHFCIPNLIRCQSLHIAVHQTPNEESRIFTPEGIPSLPLSAPSEPLWFPNSKSSEGISPLAEKLFQVDGVSKIMVKQITLTITKQPTVPWSKVQPAVILTFNKCLSNGTRFQLKEERSAEEDESDVTDSEGVYDFSPESDLKSDEKQNDDNEDDLISCMKEVIAKRVAPMVEDDGGHIKFKKFDPENGIVWIELLGACDGCPSSTSTVKGHVEIVLKYFFEEVVEVRLWKEGVEANQE